MSIRRISFSSIILLVALLFVTSPLITRAAAPPRVLAFYYAWFDANSWSPNLVADIPAQPYVSIDPAAIARQIAQAQGAGIDAFVVSWLGTNNPTDSNFKTMLGLAQNANFSATIDFETEKYGTTDAVVNTLSYVRDNLMPQPAFLRDGGRPVLFFWREQNFSVSDWSRIRASVDPNHQQIWIAEGVDTSYQQVFDGHHLYSIAWSPNLNQTLNDWASRVRRAGSDKVWVATVMPGYDDTHTGRSSRFARARNNGDFYRASWNAALNSGADWVIITSFNEWVEGSEIEPGETFGNLYLDLTKTYADQFHSGIRPAPPAATRVPIPAAPTSTPQLKPNERITTDILRVRAGPGYDYEILGRLPSDKVIEIHARSSDGAWLQIAYPNAPAHACIQNPAQCAWVKDPASFAWVAAEFVAPQSGFDALPIAVPPTPILTPSLESTATITPESSITSQPDEIPSELLPPWY